MTVSHRHELLNSSLTLRREDSQSTKLLRFEVTSDYAELQVEITIPPLSDPQRLLIQPEIKAALDRYYMEGDPDPRYAALDESEKQAQVQHYARHLRHFVSISIYDSSGIHLGRRDARSCKGISQFSIGPFTSSPGFHSAPITIGVYTIALEIAQILENDIEVAIRVVGLAATESSAVREHPPSEAVSDGSCPERSPRPDPGHWFTAMVLVPTHHGEGKYSAASILTECERIGLDVLILADVNSSVVWDEPPPDSPLMLLFGQVFDTYKGRSAGLGLNHPILVNDAENPTTTQWLADRVHEEMGWFAVLHPYSLGEPIEPGMRWTHDDLDLTTVDWLQVWPGPWRSHSPEIVNALRLWDYLLCNGLRTCGFAADIRNSAELSRFNSLPFLRIRSSIHEKSAICEALSTGQFICTSGPTLEISLTTGSVVARTGQNAILDEGTTYQIIIDAADYGRSAMLRIIRDGALFVEMPLSSNGTDRKVFHALATQEQTYFRAEIHQFGYQMDTLLALTNPVIQTTVPVWRNRPSV